MGEQGSRPSYIGYVDGIVEPLCEGDYLLRHEVDERGVIIFLEVEERDLPRMIGKKGCNIQAIRTILHTLGTRTNSRIAIKVDALSQS